jgi:FkbM family methyltransferase
MINKIKQKLSLYLKEKVLNHYLIPFSRTQCEPALVKYLEKKRITYIDVGASTGEFAKKIDKYFGLKKAVLIDPIPKLQKNIENYNKNIKKETCALSNKRGTKKFNLYNFHYSSSLLKNLENKIFKSKNKKFKCSRIPVKVKTLDDVYKERFFGETIDLLKIDVQGSELDVLKGGSACLKKTKYIFLEISFKQIYKGSATFFEIDKFLRNKRFYLLSLHEGYRGPFNELLQGDALYKRKK